MREAGAAMIEFHYGWIQGIAAFASGVSFTCSFWAFTERRETDADLCFWAGCFSGVIAILVPHVVQP